MRACDGVRIEAWLDDALSPSEGAELAAHLQACLGCARELAAQRRERSLFVQRARSSPPPVPDFEAVLAAARGPRPHRARRTAPAWIAAAMSAASVVLLALATVFHPAGYRGRGRTDRDVQLAAAPQTVGSGGACYFGDSEDPPTVELAEATEDARFAACLVASPVPGDRCL